MGQAKNRGNYEERKQKAIEENRRNEFKIKMARNALVDNHGKSKVNLLLAAVLAIGANK